jgi:CBS domain-containing protein
MRKPLIGAHRTSIRDAAQRMTDTGATSVVVDPRLAGILTDRDRARVWWPAGCPTTRPSRR